MTERRNSNNTQTNECGVVAWCATLIVEATPFPLCFFTLFFFLLLLLCLPLPLCSSPSHRQFSFLKATKRPISTKGKSPRKTQKAANNSTTKEGKKNKQTLRNTQQTNGQSVSTVLWCMRAPRLSRSCGDLPCLRSLTAILRSIRLLSLLSPQSFSPSLSNSRCLPTILIPFARCARAPGSSSSSLAARSRIPS